MSARRLQETPFRDVIEEIGEKCGKGSLWAKEKKEQLKSAKRYLKGDYKELVFLVNFFTLSVLAKQKFVTFCYLNKTYIGWRK